MRRSIGFLTVLPLYLAMAVAIGFVDHHVRPEPDSAYKPDEGYVAKVIAGTEAPPAKYRLLAPFAYTGLVHLTGLAPESGWLVFRWLCLVGVFAAGHLQFRSWFSAGAAVAGNAIVGVLLPLTFTNGWGHPDHLVELALFTLGCACVARGWLAAFLAVLVLAGFNRETSFLLVMMLAVAGPVNSHRIGWIAAAVGVWVAVYVGLRWWLGYVPYNPLNISNNVWQLFSWPSFAVAHDLYSRLKPWFFFALLAAPVAAIARTWAVQPRFVRASVGVVTPVFVAICVMFSSVIETRIFTPLMPLLVTGLLFAFFVPDTTSDAVTN